MGKDKRDVFISDNENRHDELRQKYGSGEVKNKLLSIEEATNNALLSDWHQIDVPQPSSTGVQEVFPEIKELTPYIDWSPFFHAWEIRGRYPKIFEDTNCGEEAKKLYHDAQVLLEKILENKSLLAKGVWGLFPANSIGDDIEIYTDDLRENVRTVFHTLRQQMPKKDKPNYALSDFIAPKSSKINDYLGCFVVSIHGADELSNSYLNENDDYSSIMVKSIADRLAEAFAEKLHSDARHFWGYEMKGELSNDELIKEKYRGIRPAPGYPAQPDHTEKLTLFDLLDAERIVGASLTESMAMSPGSSVSGLYFAHPNSRYFGVGSIGKDQIVQYAQRKGKSVQEVEKWLGPWLAY